MLIEKLFREIREEGGGGNEELKNVIKMFATFRRFVSFKLDLLRLMKYLYVYLQRIFTGSLKAVMTIKVWWWFALSRT